MFLDLTLRRNSNLIKTAFELHQSGVINPDTYVIDLDALINNAQLIKNEGDRHGVKLYFMTKQFGRNPYIAKELMKLGYNGAVAVDFREAQILKKNNIKLGHVGHIVQIPSGQIGDILLSGPEVITIYSIEKAEEISRAANKLGINQNIMMRVIDNGDVLYEGQYGGFYLKDVLKAAEKILKLPNIKLHGLTSFPCFLYDNKSRDIVKTKNAETVLRAMESIENGLSIKLNQINLPSATCSSSIKKIMELGGTHGEPGHGLLGTTPLHGVCDEVEVPSIVYVSEVSHNFGGSGYLYGGGYYRRSHIKGALVGKSLDNMKKINVNIPSNESIDYYIGLSEEEEVGKTAVLSFRTQVFVTRSQVALISGIGTECIKLIGIYDSQGSMIRGGERVG